MTREEARENMQRKICEGCYKQQRTLGFCPSPEGCVFCKLPTADQILAIKGIRIEADDQSLPTYNGKTFMGGEKAKFFIKALNKAGWVKCLPKEET